MKRKLLKGFYCVAIMLLSAGAICFAPSLKGQGDFANEAANETDVMLSSGLANNSSAFAETVNEEETLTRWDSKFSNMSKAEVEALAATVESSTATRPDGTYHLIASVDDLAMVSYQILNGNTTWASYNYELTANLDLSGSLWTPIGTRGNAFKGTFYGGNRTITNISVATISTTSDGYAGLFGYTSGAKISNTIINGFKYSDASSTTYAGALIGYAGANTIVSNCYSIGTSGITAGIGTCESTVKVYRGGSRDGVTAHYTTDAAINGAFTVSNGTYTSGYAVTYICGSGAGIVKYSSRTSWSSTQYIYQTYGSNITTSGTVQDSFGNYGSMPGKRSDVMRDQSGNFAIKEGYAFTFKTGSTTITDLTAVSTLKSNGLLVNLAWATKNYTVNIHYGYNKTNGTERTETRSVGNDFRFDGQILPSSLTRVGYTLASQKFGTSTGTSVGQAGACYVGDSAGLSGTTYQLYLGWTAKTNIAYNIDYTNATSDAGFNPANAVSSMTLKEGATTVNPAAGTTYDYDVTNHTSSNTVTIELTLNWGYSLATGSANFNSSKPTMSNAGVYLVFGSGSYDTYIPTSASITGNETLNKKTYTITISNLVGSGQIYLAFVRDVIDVTLDGENVTWQLSGLANAKGGTSPVYTSLGSTTAAQTTLSTRVGEKFKLTATRSKADYFITEYGYSGVAGTYGGDAPTVSGTKDATYDHYTDYSWEISQFISTSSGADRYFTAKARALTINIVIKIVHNETYSGATLATAGVKDHNEVTNDTLTMSANIVEGAVIAFMQENAYYALSSASNKATITSTNPDETPSLETLEVSTEGYKRHEFTFNPKIIDNKGTPTYTITFNAVPQIYNVKAQIVINGSAIDNATAAKFFSSFPELDTKLHEGKPNSGFSNEAFAFELSALGQMYLIFDQLEGGENKIVVEPDENDTRPGTCGTLESTTFYHGTKDSIITAYLNYKTFNIAFSNEAVISGVNNTSDDASLADAINSLIDTTGNAVTQIATTADASGIRLSGDIGSIDIVNGYYLLGWYLKNGSTIVRTNNGALSLATLFEIGEDGVIGNADILGMLGSGATTTITIQPVLKQKTITLNITEGNDVNDLISYKTVTDGNPTVPDGSAEILTSYIYYHNQETFTDISGNVYGGASAFSFKNNNLDVLFQKVASLALTGYRLNHNSVENIFNITGGKFSTLDVEINYGEDNEITLDFVPVFDNKIVYTVIVGNNQNADTTTINISMGDTITLTTATTSGTVTYDVTTAGSEEVKYTVTTSEVPGYAATANKQFIFTGENFEGSANSSEKVTSFTLTEGNIKDFLSKEFYYSDKGENNFTITTQLEPITYQIRLSVNESYEKLVEGTYKVDTDGKYVEVVYNTNMPELKAVSVSRLGYKLAGWMNTATNEIVLDKDEDGNWNDAIYKVAGNMTVKPVWVVDTDNYYINIDEINGSELYYVGMSQEVASVTLSTDTVGEAVTTGTILEGNGDYITAQYWAKEDSIDDVVESSTTLHLTNVSESGRYVYVIKVQSANANLQAEAYTIISDPVQVTIKANEIIVKDAAIKGYYTGTSDYIAHADSILGTLYYKYNAFGQEGEAIDEGIASFENIQFIDDSTTNKFNVKAGYSVRYFVNLNENAENFAQIKTLDEKSYVVVDAVGEIVTTTIVLNVYGKGLYAEGMVHEVPYTTSNANGIDLEAYGIVATADIFTASYETKTYSAREDFEVNNFAVNIDVDSVTNNFDFVISGTYTIEAATIERTYTTQYLTASSTGALNGLNANYANASYILTITNITVNGKNLEEYSASKTFYTYIDENGVAALTIFGNGSNSLTVAVNSEFEVGLTVQVSALLADNNLTFLGYFGVDQDYQQILKNFTNSGNTSSVVSKVEGKQTIFAVFTDAKAVTLNNGISSETIYVSAGSEGVIVDNPTNKGLTFANWDFAETDGSVAAMTGEDKSKFTVTVGSVPATATAVWTLDAPETEKTGATVTKTASETNVNLTFEDAAGSITNKNTAITYTYAWFKGEETTPLSLSETLSFAKLTTDDNGGYKVVITATYGEYTQTTTVPFTLNVETIKITSFTLSSLSEVYKNGNYATEVKAILNMSNSEEASEYLLSNNMDGSRSIYFTIAGDSELRNVKTYLISLNVNTKVYTITGNGSVNFDITKASYELTGVEITKDFGSPNPKFEVVKNVLGENITFYFEESTETAVGRYSLVYKNCSSDANYDVTASENYYEILALKAGLRISFVEEFKAEYSKVAATQIVAEFDTDAQVWYFVAKDASNNEIARVEVSLKYGETADENKDLTSEMLEKALDEFDFALAVGSAINAGNYVINVTPKADIENPQFEGGAAFIGTNKTFNIEQAVITVNSVSKTFDKTTTFSSNTTGHTVDMTGVVSGDVVIVSGSFASAHVGKNIGITFDALGGADAANYKFAETLPTTGTIEASGDSINVSIGTNEFMYGEINNIASLADILGKVGPSVVAGADVEDLIQAGHVNISGFEIVGAQYSTSNNLKAGKYTLNLTIESNDYTIVNNVESFEITIKEIQIDLSGATVTKVYDGTTDLPDVAWDLSEVISGDKVSVTGSYDDITVATGKVLNLALAGDDKDNYTISNVPTGTIERTSVRLNVDYTTLSDFVNDGESVNVNEAFFDVPYPATKSMAEILADFHYPTRTGYTVVGWKYNKEISGEVGKEEVNATTLQEVLDNAFKSGKELTIFANWERNNVTVTVNVTNANVFLDNDTTAKSTFVIPYYSDITLAIKAVQGYKFTGYEVKSGTVSGVITPSGVNTRNDGKVTLANVKTDVTLDLTVEEIKITVTADPAVPANSNLVSQDWSEKEYSYSSINAAAVGLLPDVNLTAGTYKLNGWSYYASEEEKVVLSMTSTDTLLSIVGTDLNTDIEIIFTAEWLGENYTITFDATDGAFEGSTTSINAVYGSPLSETFPTAVLAGKSNTWNTSADATGKYYKQNDVLETIGTLNGSVYEFTLYAVWSNASSSLTVTFDTETITVETSSGKAVNDGDEFELVYSVDSLSLTITTPAGYTFDAKFTNEADGTITTISRTIKIENLNQDSTLTITLKPNQNSLTITNANSTITSVSSVKEGETVTEISQVIVADTGTQAVITFTPADGYIFDENSSIVLTGSGKYEVDSTYPDGKLVLTWKDFTSGATLNVNPTAKVNTITFDDSSNYVEKISINSTSLNVKGDTYDALTGTELIISVTLKYGYVNANLGIVGATLTPVMGVETFDEATRLYSQTFTLNGYTGAFSFNIDAEARAYEFSLENKNPTMGNVNLDKTSAKFNETINLSATAISDSYIFAGWYVGEELISKDSNHAFTLSETYKNALESDATVVIHGTFTYAETEITIKSSANGYLTYTYKETEYTVATNSETSKKFDFNETIVFTPHADKGYKVGEVNFYNGSDKITGKDWYDETTGLITLPVLPTDAPTLIEVIFAPDEVLVNMRVGVLINYQMSYGTDIGGKVYLANPSTGDALTTDERYHKVEMEGVTYQVLTLSTEKLYFVVENNSGYSYTLTSLNEGVIINQITLPNGKTVFEVSGMSEEVTIEVVLRAEDNSISIVFVNENEEPVPAGSISVNTKEGYVVASGNNSSEVKISALTIENSVINVTVNTNLSYTFVEDNGKPKSFIAEDKLKALVTIDEIDNSVDPTQNGYTQKAAITITGLNTNGTIYIYAQPKEYNIEFISDGHKVGNTLTKVVYGQELPPFDTRSILPDDKDSFLFLGYFSKELGQGVQYIDENGSVTSAWLENGYEWNGTNYEVQDGFYFPETNTFKLYAAWYYTKEKVTISFLPDGIVGETDVTISDIVISLDSATSWTTADNLFYAEVRTGQKMILSAYEFEGYTFKYWELTRDDGTSLIIQSPVYEYESKIGSVFIKAVYFGNFELTTFDESHNELDGICGEAYIMQEGLSLGKSGAYDTTKNVTLVAAYNPGYTFKGWIDTTTGLYLTDSTGRIILGDLVDKSYRYTIPQLINTPLSLKAVFEGAEIGVRFDFSQLSSFGSLNNVTINGQTLGLANEYDARVGDTIELVIDMSYGYGVTWQGAIFTGSEGKYTYRIDARDLEQIAGSKHENVLVVRPIATPDPIKYVFGLEVEGELNSSELELVGQLIYRDGAGNAVTIVNDSEITSLFGRTVTIDVVMKANYKIGSVYLIVDGRMENISNTYLDAQKQIVLTSDILERYQVSGEVRIIVNYARMLWTEYRSQSLSGNGTQSDPYIIATAEDFAFVAYAVNRGLLNESNLAYTDAYYNVTNDIDFTGKYWVPIGTEENPFNGIINLNTYSVKGITHFMTYLPTTYHEGLIWHMTERAQVLRTNSSLVLILSIVGGILLLLLLIILIIVIVRRRKKKRMEELANG